MAKSELADHDKFRKEVFRYVHYLESLNEPFQETRANMEGRGGCLGAIISEIGGSTFSASRRHYRDIYQLAKHQRKAILLLQDEEIKSRLCSVLSASDVLPLDVAAKITPPLYELATEDPTRVSREPILFAVIARKIAKDGAEQYCTA